MAARKQRKNTRIHTPGIPTDHSEKSARQEQPAGSPATKRSPDVVRDNKDRVVAQWLERVNSTPSLIVVALSEPERKDHVPDLLDEAIAHACGHAVEVDERQNAAERHGTLRYHQGYSIPMLIVEAQLLQDVIAECLRDNFRLLDVSNLLPDIAKIAETIAVELADSARAYMSQYEWHAAREWERARKIS